MSDAQRVKLMAFTEETVKEAVKAYERQRLQPRDPFAFFFSICKRLAIQKNEPLDWTKVNFIKQAYSIPDESPQISTLTKEKKPDSYLCSSCKNKPSVCICSRSTKEITCICFKEPNSYCRGYGRVGSKNFHVKAAYEHFEKFKNKKGLAFLQYPEDYNPFKKEYEQWLTVV